MIPRMNCLQRLSKFLVISAILFVSCSKFNDDYPPLLEEEKKDSISLLVIGNSFSVDAVEKYLYELITETGRDIIISNLYYPSCSLEMHRNYAINNDAPYICTTISNEGIVIMKDTPLEKILKTNEWDFVSFQQVSFLSGRYDTYNPFLSELKEYIMSYQKKVPLFIWHQTWAYAKNYTSEDFSYYGNSQESMFWSIVNATRQLCENRKVDVLVPCGTAVQNARNSDWGDNLNRDGRHLNDTLGRFTAACTWYEALTGANVMDNLYIPSDISKENAVKCKVYAHRAVISPYIVMSSY